MSASAAAAPLAREWHRGDAVTARPVQAALASAASFAVGALMPIGTAAAAPDDGRGVVIAGTSLVFLAALGAIAARAGGAPAARGALRVTVWGAPAMAFTAPVGWAFGVSIA
jgi:vacuolar iron transporter family protein